jgi:lipopolysaccharide cholinephosphotransferase
MYRKDLNRLVNIIRKDYSEKFFVQDFESDKNYTRYITKIRLNGTSQAEEGYADDDIHQGIYIDIFPLDHVTKTDGPGLKLRGKLLRLLFAYKSARCTKNKPATKIKKILIKICKPFTYLVPMKLVNFLFDWTCTATDKDGAAYTTSFASHYLWKKQLVPNEVYGEGILYNFEDCMLRVPAQYERLLLQIFGENYMQLPSPEKRNSGHTLVEIDLGKYESVITES